MARYRLSEISPLELTICRKGAFPAANDLIRKSDDPTSKHPVTFIGPIRGMDKPKKQIFGYIYGPNIEDSQGHYAEPQEVERAAHRFFLNVALNNQKGLGVGINHEDFSKFDYPIESLIDRDGTAGISFGFEKENCIPGGWLVGIQCCDDTWEKVEKGELAAMSMGGEAVHTPVEGPDEGPSPAQKIGAALKLRFEQFLRKEGPMSYDEALATRQSRDALWQMLDAMVQTVANIAFGSGIDKKEKKSRFTEAMKQFQNAILPLLASDIALADTDVPELVNQTTNINNISIDGGMTMTPDEIKNLITAATEPLKKSVDDLEAKVAALEKAPTDFLKADDGRFPEIAETLDKFTKKLTEVDTRITKMENKPGERNGSGPEGKEPVKKSGAEGTPLSLR